MSDAHDAHADAHAATAHGADDHHHDFDGEPVQELSAGEPRTPNWVPALGLAVFVVAAIGFLISAGDVAATASPPQPAAAAQQRPATPPPAATPAARGPQQPGAAAAPAASGSGNVRRLSPEEMDALKARLKKAQEQRQQQGQQPGQPAAPGRAPTPAPAAPGHEGHGH